MVDPGLALRQNWIKIKIKNMNAILNKYKTDLIGIVLGAFAGFMYWKFVGCASGTFMITSKPLNSILYGALMGYLVAGIFKKN